MRSLLRRVAWWLRPSRKEDELHEELQFHLAAEADERRARGMADDEAEFAAQRDLGNEARVREEVRAVWTWRPIEELSQDLRFAFRTLFKERAIGIFAVASLALGIGANTAIYSFIDAILLRTLPVGDPSTLVVMSWQSKPFDFRKSGAESQFVLHSIDGSIYPNSAGYEARIFPWAALDRFRNTASSVMSSVFARFAAGKVNLLIDGDADLVDAEYVTGDFFAGIAVPPAAGRLLLPDDDRAGAPAVTVIGGGYAERRFGSASRAIGRSVFVNNIPFTIVGVMPHGFNGVDPGITVAVYLPMQTAVGVSTPATIANRFDDPTWYWLGIMGRIRPGVTRAQAESVLAASFAQLTASTASTDAERANLPVLRLDSGAGGFDTLRRKYSKPLYVLFGIVGLILLIACANTANLLMARAATRQREIAVRLSMGAGRFRLIRQLLTESLALALLSAVAGIGIAIGGARLLTALLANSGDSLTIDAALNTRVLTVTVAVSLACGLLFGLAPAIQSTHLALMPALKDMTRLPRYRLRQVLVVSQIALLAVILVAAGLFVRTLANLQAVPLGFNRDHLLLFSINAPQAGYPEAKAAAFYNELRQRLTMIPGVRAATVSHASLLMAGRGHPVAVDGVPAPGTRFMQTGPAFFSTMQIPMLQGREIDDRDRTGSLPVVVVSEQFAEKFLPGQNPLGRHLTVGGSAGPLDLEIIGVAADTKYGRLRDANPPVIYVPITQLPASQVRKMVYALRTDVDPLGLAKTVRELVRDADPRIPVTGITTQDAQVGESINEEIVLARLASAFAILALLIAAVGLYGTVSYAVARRTREIGIRVALGARRAAVMWMVMREVIVLTAIGLLISIPVARGGSKLISSFLFQMTPNDPRALTFAVVSLVAVGLAAGYGPARRALRIEPTTALREE